MHPMVNPSVVSRPRDAQLEERDSLLKDVTQSFEQATAKWVADRMVHRELPHSGSSCSGNLPQTNTAREFSVHDSAKFHLGNKITVNQVVEKPKGIVPNLETWNLLIFCRSNSGTSSGMGGSSRLRDCSRD